MAAAPNKDCLCKYNYSDSCFCHYSLLDLIIFDAPNAPGRAYKVIPVL